MCGRFTREYTWEDINRFSQPLTVPDPIPNFQPRYNICPTTKIDAIAEREGKRKLISMRWGLMPAWWKKQLREFKVATFNARVESVLERPMFRRAFKEKRCIIPASGYYEDDHRTWKTAALLYPQGWRDNWYRRVVG